MKDGCLIYIICIYMPYIYYIYYTYIYYMYICVYISICIYISISIYIYIYLSIYLSIHLSLSLYIYIYIFFFYSNESQPYREPGIGMPVVNVFLTLKRANQQVLFILQDIFAHLYCILDAVNDFSEPHDFPYLPTKSLNEMAFMSFCIYILFYFFYFILKDLLIKR